MGFAGNRDAVSMITTTNDRTGQYFIQTSLAERVFRVAALGLLTGSAAGLPMPNPEPTSGSLPQPAGDASDR